MKHAVYIHNIKATTRAQKYKDETKHRIMCMCVAVVRTIIPLELLDAAPSFSRIYTILRRVVTIVYIQYMRLHTT